MLNLPLNIKQALNVSGCFSDIVRYSAKSSGSGLPDLSKPAPDATFNYVDVVEYMNVTQDIYNLICQFLGLSPAAIKRTLQANF